MDFISFCIIKLKQVCYGLTTIKKMISEFLSGSGKFDDYAEIKIDRKGYKQLQDLNSEIYNTVYTLPSCEIVDYPSVEVRAVAPTFSWYSGYGRLGFDMQLWGYDEWVEYLYQCVDQKIINLTWLCMDIGLLNLMSIRKQFTKIYRLKYGMQKMNDLLR